MLARGNENFFCEIKNNNKNSFTRKMFRILTKRILTCLFLKKGLFSILVQNSQKVTKKVLVFRKVARSCSLTKKLLKILKVAEQNLERPNPSHPSSNSHPTVFVTGVCGKLG